jgi:hypothetical protein
MSKNFALTVLIIIIVILVALAIIYLPKNNVEKETAQCIGKNSVLYVQLGCRACETQEELFGDSYQYLNVVDCFFERELCAEKEIGATPTWIINNVTYKGVQKIKTLEELTGCK